MRVLVVEDERTLAEGLRMGLEAEGFAADVTHDGIDGLHMAREHAYDAIVLDIMLPRLNGYRVCAELREAGDLDADPHAHRKGRGVRRSRGAGHRCGRLRHEAVLLRRSGGPPAGADQARGRRTPPVLEAGDLRFDPGARRAWRGDTEVTLTSREASLFEFLLHRAGEVVSKTEILDHVWDDRFDGDLNIVEVYVRHLRNKLDRPFDRESIETVRGAGYRLAEDGG